METFFRDQIERPTLVIWIPGCVLAIALCNGVAASVALFFNALPPIGIPGYPFYITEADTWPNLITDVAKEEFAFRVLPLTLVSLIANTKTNGIAVAILSSVFFGCMHGDIANIFFQGVAGLFYSLVFLQCGEWCQKPLKGFLACFLAHFVFDSIIVFAYLALGRTYI